MIRLYTKGNEPRDFFTLLSGRRAFTDAALRGWTSALVREDGFSFEVSYNDTANDKVVVTRFGRSTDAAEYIHNMFNSH